MGSEANQDHQVGSGKITWPQWRLPHAMGKTVCVNISLIEIVNPIRILSTDTKIKAQILMRSGECYLLAEESYSEFLARMAAVKPESFHIEIEVV